jgi:hypothetical protein
MKRWARAVAGAVIGAAIGGLLGVWWFSVFGSDEEIFGDFAAALAGGVVGAVAIGSLGWSFSCWRTASPLWRAGALVAWIACGGLLVVGIVYIGGWTDSDGPNREAMVGILGIPGSLLGVWFTARNLCRHRLTLRSEK